MYKTMSLEAIQNIKSWFFQNLKHIYENEWFTYFKQFIKKINESTTDEVLYFKSNEIFFRIVLKDDEMELIDEQSAIKLKLDDDNILKIHNLLKKKIESKWKQNISNTLFSQFESQNMKKYLGKDFLVYDIETIWNIQNLKETKFMIAYMIDTKDFQDWNVPKYKFIWRNAIDKFTEYLMNYDWYIVWYNNISFDNPVTVYNSSFENQDEIIKNLNEKSLDLFLLYSKIFWKKIWLDAVASNIVNISKTLSSGAEGSMLLKQYNETWDQKALTKVKNYCKNDVKMTLTILLYLLFNGQISYQWKDISIDIDYILNYGCLKLENETKNNILWL